MYKLEIGMRLLVGLLLFHTGQGIHHNLPPGTELVDPASLGFDSSQIDLSSLLGGNLKLLPVNSGVDPKTGLKTQILTVGFDNENGEPLNLDDFEIPNGAGDGKNDGLVNEAFKSLKEFYSKGKSAGGGGGVPLPFIPSAPVPQQVSTSSSSSTTTTRRRKIKKPVQAPTTQPKVVELDSAQIDKLLASGKLKSKKVGDSQVIEITQEQLNDLYNDPEKGGEFRELLESSTSAPVEVPTTHAAVTTYRPPEPEVVSHSTYSVPRQTTSVSPPIITTSDTTTLPPVPVPSSIRTTPVVVTLPTPRTTTLPPLVYEYKLNDDTPSNYYSHSYLSNNRRPVAPPPQQQQHHQPHVITQQFIPQNIFSHSSKQIQKHIKTPNFEFISVPPVSFASTSGDTYNDHRRPSSSTSSSSSSGSGKVLFPLASVSVPRFHRHASLTPQQLSTYFEDDGLNYKDANLDKEYPGRGV